MGLLAYTYDNPNETMEVYKKSFILQKHRFDVSTDASGAVRSLTLGVLFDNQPLITIRQKIDGWVVGAEVADLDKNNSPEIYIYACSYGSGAFGRIYGFQFFPKSFDPIRTQPLSHAMAQGYMGHDSFKVENGLMTRRFPIYRPGDTNAQATGGVRVIQYQLKEIETKSTLVAIETIPKKP